jgi:hypothetical protein
MSTKHSAHARPRSINVHRIWHRISRSIDSDRHATDQDSKNRLITILERYRRKYPHDIFHATCDDTYFSSSSLYFILHRDRTSFMGTSVLFISQCDDQPPTRFFLYPGHVQSVQQALRACQQAFVGSDQWRQFRRIQRLVRHRRRSMNPRARQAESRTRRTSTR